MVRSQEVLAIVSTFSILVPILFSIWALRQKTEVYLWSFLLFLLFGFLVDVLSWYSYKTSAQGGFVVLIKWLYEGYPIVEAMFFLWIIKHFSRHKLIRDACRILVFLVIPIWFATEVAIASIESFATSELGLFHMIYRVLSAFLASYSMLLLVEDGDRLVSQTRFWILLGILFYTFSTFFLLLMRNTSIASQLWYLHNTMNILTYIIYSVGFYVHRKYS